MKKRILLLSLALPSCLLQPKPEPSSANAVAPAAGSSAKKEQIFERWSALGEGMFGVAKDTKGSKMEWKVVEEGPKRGQKALLLDYDMKPGGWCGAWHTTTHLDLSKADGVRFMARMDPPGAVMFSMTDANRVSYIANFQVPTKEWTEIRIPLAALDKNPNYQPDDAKQGKPVDWARTTSMNFDARTEGQAKIWIGPVAIDDAQ
jgi:hypothetical protein